MTEYMLGTGRIVYRDCGGNAYSVVDTHADREFHFFANQNGQALAKAAAELVEFINRYADGDGSEEVLREINAQSRSLQGAMGCQNGCDMCNLRQRRQEILERRVHPHDYYMPCFLSVVRERIWGSSL